MNKLISRIARNINDDESINTGDVVAVAKALDSAIYKEDKPNAYGGHKVNHNIDKNQIDVYWQKKLSTNYIHIESFITQ